MLRETTLARLWLGLATMALASLGHAASVIDLQAVGQTATPSWIEPLVLGGEPQEGVLGIASDRDYWRMDVTEPAMVAIYTDGPDRTLLYDLEGREIADARFHEDIITFLPRPGRYYLTVELDLSFERDRGYTIRAERLPTPRLLSLDGPPQIALIAAYGELDTFRLQVTEPTVATLYTTGGVDSSGTLLDPDGREIASADEGGEEDNFRLETFLGRPGTYYLLVANSSFLSTGGCIVHAESGESPRGLSLDGPSLEGSIKAYGEADYFRLQVTEPTVVTTYTTGGLDSSGTWLDLDGREMASARYGGEGDNFRFETFFGRPGTYYLRVELSYSFKDPGSYNLHAERGESPRELSLGGLPLEGSIEAYSESDFFQLQVTEPTVATLYTTGGTFTGLDSFGTLLDPDGREIASDDDRGEGDNFRIEALLLHRGTYSLRVRRSEFGLFGGGGYKLHAEGRESQARALPLDGPPQEGAVLADGDAEYFRLQLTNPTNVAIRTSGGVDTAGELYDPDGGLIASDDDGGEGNNFRIDAVLLRRGTYVLRIVPSHPDFTGSYTLHSTSEP